MSAFSASEQPPEHWGALCDENGALFGSAEWQRVLEHGFGCRSLYFSNAGGGFVISVFRAGPFSVGYLGFPVGGIVGGVDSGLSIVDTLKSADPRAKPTCVRVPVSGFGPKFRVNGTSAVNPETVITDLQNWDLAAVSKNLRRDVRRAQRMDFSIEPSTNADDGRRLHEIYEATVKRQGGSLRYSADYFHSLVELSRRSSRLRVLLARREDEIAGFIVIGGHAGTAYYLHGGAAPEFRKESPSDLLLSDAIAEAKRDGYRCFSLMASPADQPSLVRYKEKWGGETRDLNTVTVVLRPGYHLFRVAERILAGIR